jgi:hypothetical protein
VKQESGGLLLLRRITPLTRSNTVYFCSGAVQAKIVAEYLTDLNATRSAIAAGYSEKTAEPAASRLLGNVRVSAEVARQ